ncbi:Protein CONTINUOUS VASCULAR RING 1 [Linum perenne]
MNRKKIKTLEISKQLDNSFHPRLANYCLQIETKAYYCPAGRREIRLRESSLLLLLLLHCRRRLSLLSSGRFWKEYNQRRLILSLFGGVMADDKSAIVMTSMEPNREPDRELLIHVSDAGGRDTVSPKPSSSSSHHHSGRETFSKVIRSWASKKFMTGCVILFPIAITFYITWWFIHFVDGFFSPIYAQLGINIFGLGFITSITFIFVVGVFMSSWLGASVLSLGEWFIKRMPFVRHIYNASKQIGAAISPDQNTQAFKEVAIIRHPRIGEYAFGFITSSVTLQFQVQNYAGDEELCCVYVPTNHLYIGDIFLVSANDVIRPNLSVREGIEIVVSGGMSMPQMLSTLDSHVTVDRNRLSRS